MKTLVIVGRPNVGKSTLFNRLAKMKISITEPLPGITRDMITTNAKCKDVTYHLIDTGGMTFKEDGIEKQIDTQVEIAINEADVVLFVVDGHAGVTAEDDKIAKALRKINKEVFVAVNKLDKLSKQPEKIFEFYSLGFEKVFSISAEHAIGTHELIKSLYPILKSPKVEKEERIKISIVGRPNAGKSMLTNSLLGKPRSIVSDVAGTTRDIVSSEFDFEDNKYEIVDTAGIRKKARVSENTEYYSVIRAIKTIRSSDVVIIVIDKEDGVREQDQKIAGLASDASKPVVIALNKIDLSKVTEKEIAEIKESLKFTYAPVVPISALTKKGVHKLIQKAKEVYDEDSKRISTSLLNTILREIVIAHEPPMKKGHRVRITYMTQVDVNPPVFIVFCNKPELLHLSYVRRIEKGLRNAFGFEGVNITVKVKAG